MLPPSSYHNIYYHILQYNKTKYLTKNYRLYAACRHFSYFGTVKDPISTSFYSIVFDIIEYNQAFSCSQIEKIETLWYYPVFDSSTDDESL